MSNDPRLAGMLSELFHDALIELQLNTELELHWWNAILDAYGSKHRVFHTLRHLSDMFFDIDYNISYGQTITKPEYQFLTLVVFFSDFAFDASNASHKVLSAKYWAEFAKSVGIPDAPTAHGWHMIMSLEDHDPHNDLSSRLCDADLGWLAEYDRAYMEGVVRLRSEYSFLNDHEWAVYRLEQIEKFLARPTIYCAANATNVEEGGARRNLLEERERINNFLIKTGPLQSA